MAFKHCFRRYLEMRQLWGMELHSLESCSFPVKSFKKKKAKFSAGLLKIINFRGKIGCWSMALK